MVLSTLGFSVMHAMIQYLGTTGIHGFEIAFFRNVFGFFALLPILLRHGLTPLKTKRMPLHGVRAVVNSVAMLLFFYGITTGIALDMVQALTFTAPLFVSVLAVLFLGERFRAHRTAALVIGFVGALIILRPGIAEIHPGAVYILCSALVWGVAMIIIKRLTATDSAITVSLYMVLFMGPISGVAAAFVWTWPTPEQWPWLVAIGIVGTGAQLTFTQAFRMAEATAVLPFDFGKLIFSAALGYVFFAQVLDFWVWVGGVLIFLGGFYIAWRERKVKGAVETRPDPTRAA